MFAWALSTIQERIKKILSSLYASFEIAAESVSRTPSRIGCGAVTSWIIWFVNSRSFGHKNSMKNGLKSSDE